jgi:hypothetical protein
MLGLLFLFAQSSEAFSVGDWVCVKAGENLRSTACGDVLWASNGNERGKVLSITSPSCSMGNYTWLQVAMDDFGPTFYVADIGYTYVCGIPSGSKYIDNVPYVHQLWDTGDSFDGDWACGPTSSLMAMAYYGKLTSHSIKTSTPWVHNNSYGYYDSAIYTSPTGFVFNREQDDPNGAEAWGAYGTCTDQGEAWAYRIQDYVNDHGGYTGVFYDTTTTTLLKQSIDAGSLVIQSTELSSVGHLVLIVGYTSDGQFIANDPWGDANLPNWGIYPNGAYVTYSWSKLAAKWCVVVQKNAVDSPLAPLAPTNVSTNVRDLGIQFQPHALINQLRQLGKYPPY